MSDPTDRVASDETHQSLSALSNELLISAIWAMPDLVLVVDRHGRTLDCNDNEDLILPRAQIIGQTMRELLPPDLADRSMRAIEEALDFDHQVTFEYSLEIQGRPSWFEARVRRISDDHVLQIIRNLDSEKAAREELTLQEEAIRLSEGRLSQVQAVAKVGNWRLDITAGELSWNDWIYELFEIDKTQFAATYEAFLDAIHPDDRERVDSAYSGSLIDRSPYHISHRLLMADGRIKWVEEHCTTSFASDGTALISLGTIRDITREHLIDEELRQFKNTIDQTTDAVFIFDAESLLFTYVNQSGIEQLGYDQAELPQIHPYDIKPEFPEPKFRDMIAPLLTGELDQIMLETVHRHKDGHLVPVELSIQYVTSAEDKTSFVSVVRDITERQKIEAALRSSEEHGRLVLKTVMSAIITIDTAGTIEGFNPAAETTFGYQADEVIDRNVKMLMPAPHHGAHDSYLSNYAKTGDRNIIGFGREVEGRHKDGTLFPLQLEVSEVTTGDHKIFIGAIWDLTDRNLAAEAILESKITKQALVEADIANQAKTEFLSLMSHEFRTPLNAILGFAQLQELDATTSDEQEAASMILTAGRHLLKLIDDVLEISLIEAGQMSLSLEAILLGDVTKECLALIGPVAGSRQIELVNRNGSEVFVQADARRLRQVILNLLSNAVKYSFEKDKITISVSPVTHDMIRITVSDTGPGIHPEAIDRIFSPFERLGAETTEVEGTGLGLALSAGLMGAMGGTIGVESTLGEGSTFWVELAQSADPTTPKKLIHDVPSSSLASGDATGKLLYIEDNLPNLRLMERVLELRPGVELIGVVNGLEGLEAAELHQPDLIFLDLHLPDIQGREVLARIRSNPVTHSIPVVIVSADANARQIRRLTEAGAYQFVTKPIDVKQILRIVDKILGPEQS